MKLVGILVIVMPASLICWIVSLMFHVYKPDATRLSPLRLLTSTIAPIIIAVWGLKKKSLDISGALAGLFVGFVLTISNFCFFSSLLMFFVTGSKMTKFRSKEKRKIEDHFKEGGQRNWVQVLCNGGIAAQFALLYLIDVGCVEKVIDFNTHYIASWFSIAVLGALSCSAGDTFASEVGSAVWTSWQPRLITTFQQVPRGTNGGVSLIGTISSVIGGMLVGVAYYVTLILTSKEYYLEAAPPQWLLIPFAALCGMLGSMIDSLLGALFQYSGFDRKRKCVVEHPGPDIDFICGSEILDNHSVNLLSSFLTAMLAPRIAFLVWSYYS